MLTAVLDNNTIVSALINPYGSPGKVLDMAFRGAFIFASSPHLIDELTQVLHTTKMVKYLEKHGKTKKDIDRFIVNFTKCCLLAANDPLGENVCRDPDDDWVLACAVKASADCIVTGDNDLISLSHYNSILILSSAEFLNKFA